VKINKKLQWLTCLSAGLALAACAGKKGEDGVSALMNIEDEAAGADCEYSGRTRSLIPAGPDQRFRSPDH
jgi:hypothetical protein